MCRGKGMNVMVMDVEGTDGRERGEDQVRSIVGPAPYVADCASVAALGL